MPEDASSRVAELEKRASYTRLLLTYASRAFVIEFAGTPKSGKSTSIEGIRHFFSEQGSRVHVLVERASVCPIPMKGHLFFNTWCAASMLAELLANVETETDIIILDRGLLDALMWLTMQERRGEVNAAEARTIESFLLLDRWRSVIDMPVVMTVSVDEAMRRENSQRITQKDGSVMNPEVLNIINESVDHVVQHYVALFGSVVHCETTGKSVRESLVELAENILEGFQAFLNPEILVMPRDELVRLPLKGGGSFGPEAINAALSCIDTHRRFMRRHDAESNFDYVQVIPCGLLEYKDRVFLFSRKDTDPKCRLYDKTTIWQGCHAGKTRNGGTAAILKSALLGKVSRSLFLSRVFPVEPLGYCWDRDDEISGRHFGVMFQPVLFTAPLSMHRATAGAA